MTDHTLRDKVAVIAGGAKNLGGVLSRRFAEAGADVVVHYHDDSSAGDAEDTAKAVRAAGRRAIAVQGDLTQVSEVRRLFDTTVDEFGGVDVAVNTVGMVTYSASDTLPPSPVRRSARCSGSSGPGIRACG
ncbi:MAG: SDR family NAD(P)-dependent oxidoreductase [Actinophytocola sp.]|nr:SDR family NAD(P)-dependent oxidoreductase [Actinophytocola sp.]